MADSPLTRRRALVAGAVVGSTPLAGCGFSFGRMATCEEGRTKHERELDLESDASWPMLYADAANTGHARDTSGPEGDVTAAWRYSTCGEGAFPTLLVGAGRVYVSGGAHDARTGTRTETSWVPLAMGDDTLFVDDDGLAAIDVETGAERWRFESVGVVGARWAIVSDDTLYAVRWDKSPSVYAVDVVAGTERWRRDVGRNVKQPPALADGTLVVLNGSQLVALDVETGQQEWQTEPEQGEKVPELNIEGSPPVVADGTVFLGSFDASGHVLALDAATGEVVWREPVYHRVRGPVAVADGDVYVAGRDGSVTSLSASDGTITWQESFDARELTPPAIADGTLYLGSDSGSVSALDAANGGEHWRFQTRAVDLGDWTARGLDSPPVVVDDVVFCTTLGGDLYALSEAAE